MLYGLLLFPDYRSFSMTMGGLIFLSFHSDINVYLLFLINYFTDVSLNLYKYKNIFKEHMVLQKNTG